MLLALMMEPTTLLVLFGIKNHVYSVLMNGNVILGCELLFS